MTVAGPDKGGGPEAGWRILVHVSVCSVHDVLMTYSSAIDPLPLQGTMTRSDAGGAKTE